MLDILPFSGGLQRLDRTPVWLPESTDTGDELERTRFFVKNYFGPCDQGGFVHAVLSPPGMNEVIDKYARQIGMDEATLLRALDWVIWNIGHGDLGCANFLAWAYFTVHANPEVFTKTILSTLDGSRNVGKHSNLVEDGGIHFTAANIPRVTTKGHSLKIEWEPIGNLGGHKLLGNPPSGVRL